MASKVQPSRTIYADKSYKATAETLPWDELVNIEKFLKPYFLLQTSVEKYFWNIANLKSYNGIRKQIALFVYLFMWFIFARALVVQFFDHDQLFWVLGHGPESHKLPQITVLVMLWSLFTAMTAENFYNSHRLSVQQLGWLEPFQVLLGKKSPHDYGLNPSMTAKFRKRVITKLNTHWLIAAGRSVLGSAVFAAVYMNEKEHDENHLKLIWCIALTVWCHLSSVIIYVTLAFFDCICYYFRIRYMKVNNDIETVLHNKEKFKQDERIRFMQHILHEHNYLCSKVDEYNLFWSRFISHVFFVFTPVTIYGLYQAIFAQHTWVEIILLSLVAVEAWSIISLMCFQGAFFNDQAHAPYMQLIRCMFEYYPPDIHLQMRILVQRVSGPAIAFYCSDLFEVAHTSYFAICMALGQNFFLLVDFVQANLAAANMQTNNSTMSTAVTPTEASA